MTRCATFCLIAFLSILALASPAGRAEPIVAGGDGTAHDTRFYFQLADGTILETDGDLLPTGALDGLSPRGPALLQEPETDQDPIDLGVPSHGILVRYILLVAGAGAVALRLHRWKSITGIPSAAASSDRRGRRSCPFLGLSRLR